MKIKKIQLIIYVALLIISFFILPVIKIEVYINNIKYINYLTFYKIFIGGEIISENFSIIYTENLISLISLLLCLSIIVLCIYKKQKYQQILILIFFGLLCLLIFSLNLTINIIEKPNILISKQSCNISAFISILLVGLLFIIILNFNIKKLQN